MILDLDGHLLPDRPEALVDRFDDAVCAHGCARDRTDVDGEDDE